jgi:hypothetical protein
MLIPGRTLNAGGLNVEGESDSWDFGVGECLIMLGPKRLSIPIDLRMVALIQPQVTIPQDSAFIYEALKAVCSFLLTGKAFWLFCKAQLSKGQPDHVLHCKSPV